LPDWLVERGIGETRMALVEDGEIVEARIRLEGVLAAGSVVAARLASIGSGGRNAVATDERGCEYLLPRGAPGVTQGAGIAIEIVRETIPGSEPWKRPLARQTDRRPHLPPPLDQFPGSTTLDLPAAVDALGDAGWNDLIEEARSGTVRFAGGELRISPTPAMTLIDVDGYLPPGELAVAGAAEAARAIRRLDIGGSIGIDLPTADDRGARHRAAAAIDDDLSRPFERTAVNGFGFVQIVRPRNRASLVELALDRAAFEARALLRRVAFEGPGGKRIVAHPGVIGALEHKSGWIDTLARQIGGMVELRADAALPISGGYAETL
jgi:hypothetical protein